MLRDTFEGAYYLIEKFSDEGKYNKALEIYDALASTDYTVKNDNNSRATDLFDFV